MTFDPNEKLMNMRGKDYLEVKWRIVWFREENPKGRIETSIAMTDPIVVKATVYDDNGNIIADGMGTPKTQGVAKSRPFEGAETAAIGRALAHAGYGTQFTGEEEGEHLADSPVEKSVTPVTKKPKKKNLTRPLSPVDVKDQLLKKVGTRAGDTMTEKQEGLFKASFIPMFNTDQERHAFTFYIFGKESINDLAPAEKLSLIDWMALEKIDGGYIPSQDAITEAKRVYKHVQEQQGQLDFNVSADDVPEREF